MEVRYTDGPDALIVAPAGYEPFEAQRGEYVDVADDVAGRAPSGEPGTEDYDPGEGLLAQGWELRPASKTKKTATGGKED